jgi:hypothetical protein
MAYILKRPNDVHMTAASSSKKKPAARAAGLRRYDGHGTRRYRRKYRAFTKEKFKSWRLSRENRPVPIFGTWSPWAAVVPPYSTRQPMC